MKLNIIAAYQDTRSNKEDFAITPFLFMPIVKNKIIALGICWGYWSIAVSMGFNPPKGFKKFLVIKPEKK